MFINSYMPIFRLLSLKEAVSRDLVFFRQRTSLHPLICRLKRYRHFIRIREDFRLQNLTQGHSA
jgi:hypothetical protein